MRIDADVIGGVVEDIRNLRTDFNPLLEILMDTLEYWEKWS